MKEENAFRTGQRGAPGEYTFTVGGGISSVDDVHLLLQNGAIKYLWIRQRLKSALVGRSSQKNSAASSVVLADRYRQEEDGEWYVYSPRKDQNRS